MVRDMGNARALAALYLAAIVVANLTVALGGPGLAVVNALLWIGLDLVLRDRLHDCWAGQGLGWRMRWRCSGRGRCRRGWVTHANGSNKIRWR